MHAVGSLIPRPSTSSASRTSRASAARASSNSSAVPHGKRGAPSRRASKKKASDDGIAPSRTSTTGSARCSMGTTVITRCLPITERWGSFAMRSAGFGIARYNVEANAPAGTRRSARLSWNASHFRHRASNIHGPRLALHSVDPRWEPGAGNLHAGFCPGGGPKGPSLPGPLPPARCSYPRGTTSTAGSSCSPPKEIFLASVLRRQKCALPRTTPDLPISL